MIRQAPKRRTDSKTAWARAANCFRSTYSTFWDRTRHIVRHAAECHVDPPGVGADAVSGACGSAARDRGASRNASCAMYGCRLPLPGQVYMPPSFPQVGCYGSSRRESLGASFAESLWVGRKWTYVRRANIRQSAVFRKRGGPAAGPPDPAVCANRRDAPAHAPPRHLSSSALGLSSSS